MNILIGENIKRLRKEKKITQEELAERFNVTPAAVSKWENNESYPDITLLFPLSHFFCVSIDELMGYNHLLIDEEIRNANEIISNAWFKENDWNKAKELAITSREKYPNNYDIMIKYLFFTTGGQADNDKKVLIENEKEITKICDLILDGCNNESYRLEALNYKAKLLYAKGYEKEALEILTNFPSFYHSSNQKIEQLYSKNTKEFFGQLQSNINELSIFLGNKIGKSIFFNPNLSDEEKINNVQSLIDLYKHINNNSYLKPLEIIIKNAVNEILNKTIYLNPQLNEKLKKICNEMK